MNVTGQIFTSIGDNPLQLDSTETGVSFQHFLMTLMFFFYLTNTGTLGLLGLKTIIFKGQEPPQGHI
jgi:hypothetical protein